MVSLGSTHRTDACCHRPRDFRHRQVLGGHHARTEQFARPPRQEGRARPETPRSQGHGGKGVEGGTPLHHEDRPVLRGLRGHHVVCHAHRQDPPPLSRGRQIKTRR